MTATTDNFPGTLPRALPGVGHLPWFIPDKLGFLERAALDPRPVVPLRLPGPTHLLKDPADLRFVLEEAWDRFDKSRYFTTEEGRDLLGHGLHTASAESHRALRRDLNPVFHHEALAGHMAPVLEAIDGRLLNWRDRVELRGEMTSLMLDASGRVLFGPDWTPELRQAVVHRQRYLHHWIQVPFSVVRRLPLPIVRRYRRARGMLEGVIRDGIARRRAEPGGTDMLAHLAALTDEDGCPLPERRLLDEALTLSITGFETMADGLVWTLHLLSRHPEIQEKLAAEVRAVVGAGEDVLEQGRPALPGDLGRLEYTGRVLQESLRLYPPTWIVLRVSRETQVLPSGTRIPAGDKLYLCPWITGRDERFFPDPARFDPDRFLQEATSRRPRLAYFPFGFGPRTCIGRFLANREGVLVLARVAQRFRLEAVDDRPVVPYPGITLSQKGPVSVRVFRRTASG